ITVDSRNTPQPRPVWFHWDGETILIFSQRNTAKLRHIARNPRVALNFNTDQEGNEVAVLIGDATILKEPPDASRLKTYLRKYKQGIKDIGMSVAEFRAAFAVPIVVTPAAMRGF
ncbi:MAG: pyridoxamine 5'-phosphate oxidase family protein, partial [Gammaproteobacteria bacterium]